MASEKQLKYWESLKGKQPKNMEGLKLGHGWNRKDKNVEMIFCSCGCGEQLNKFDKKNRERKSLPGHLLKFTGGGFKKGHKAWNKGTKGLMVAWNKGKKGFLAGNRSPHWKGGKPKCLDCGKQLTTYRQKAAQLCKSCTIKRRSPELIASILRRRPISSLERKFLNIIEKNNLPYRFVGNGAFMIERKNPDFININREKKAIEVYDKRHKDEFREGGERGWKEERIRVFGKHGWKVLFFETMQINEQNVLDILKGGDSHF